MRPEDHSGGPAGCEQLGPFVDGELAPVEAAAFRSHLVQCARCQQEMHALMQLSALAEQARDQPAQRPELPAQVIAATDRRSRPRRAAWLGVVGAVAIAAALVLALKSRGPGADLPAVLASLDARTVSGWPSAAGPGQYRPYAVSRGTEQSTPPALARAELRAEASQDLRALATVALLRRDFTRADAVLQRLPSRPDVLADRGLVRMEQGQCEDALEYLDRALDAEPSYLPALFNRGLCLRQLGLPVAAAAALGRVGSSRAGGWSAEASQDREVVQQRVSGQVERESAFAEARRKLVTEQQEPPEAYFTEYPGRARVRLNAALASAGTVADLHRLLPSAQRLDSVVGSGVMESRVRAAMRDVRPASGELAATFRGWFLALRVPPGSEVEAFVRRAMAAGQHDQALEAYANFDSENAGSLRTRLVRESGDPFHEILLAGATAAQQRFRGETLEAERTVRIAGPRCGRRSLEFACWSLDQQTVLVKMALGRFAEASLLAQQSAERMHQSAFKDSERNALLQFAEVKLAADHLAAARATFEEVGLREPESCRVTVHRGEMLATGYVRRGDSRSAQAILAALPACDLPMEPWRLELRLDLALLTRDAAGMDAVAGTLTRMLASPESTEREKAIDVLLLERARIERQEGGAPGAPPATSGFERDLEVRGARARLITARFFAQLRRDAPTAALAELGATAGSRCTAAVSRDLIRTGWAVAGASGELRSGWSPRTGSADGALVPDEARQLLAKCPEVSVLATGELQGNADLLPDALAWSYRAPGRDAPRTSGSGRVLVRDTRPPPELGLPPLRIQGLPDGADWTVLEGAEATPSRVLDAMGRAGFVEFAVHGRIDAAIPDGAMLMLSEDANRNYALSAVALGSTRLEGHPVVVLGACNAGAGSTMRTEAWSLPRALLDAGARAVIASRSALPDAEVSQFLEGVRHRMESGSSPRAALRDERLVWLGKGKPWVREVVAFD